MSDEKVSCIDCGAKILRTTANATDGQCMPCHLGQRNPKDEVAFRPWMFLFLIPPSIWGALTLLITRFVIGTNWNKALFAGFVVYMALKGVVVFIDLFDDPGAQDEKRKRDKQEVWRKWRERNRSE